MAGPKREGRSPGWLLAVALVLLSPLLIAAAPFIAVWFLLELIKEPERRRRYRNSAYYRDLKRPYRLNIANDPVYRFYNEAAACGVPIETRGEPPEEIKLRGQWYWLWLCEVFFDEERQAWMIDTADGTVPLEAEREKRRLALASTEPEETDLTVVVFREMYDGDPPLDHVRAVDDLAELLTDETVIEDNNTEGGSRNEDP